MRKETKGNGGATAQAVLDLLVKNGILPQEVVNNISAQAEAPKAEDKKGWDTVELVDCIPAKSGKSATKVQVATKDGQLYVDLRKFVDKKGQTGFNQNTVKGIALEVDSVENLDKIISSLQRARSKVVKQLEKKAVAK